MSKDLYTDPNKWTYIIGNMSPVFCEGKEFPEGFESDICVRFYYDKKCVTFYSLMRIRQKDESIFLGDEIRKYATSSVCVKICRDELIDRGLIDE